MRGVFPLTGLMGESTLPPSMLEMLSSSGDLEGMLPSGESTGGSRDWNSALLVLLRRELWVPLSSVWIELRLGSRFLADVIVGSAITSLVAFVGRLCRPDERDLAPPIKLMLPDLAVEGIGRPSAGPEAVGETASCWSS
jgi:hypothetical protein